MKKILSVLAAAALSLMTAGCSSDDDVSTITVASVHRSFNYMGKTWPHYFIKENGVGAWQHGAIEGNFGYELGYEYKLLVTKVVPDPSLEDAITYYRYEKTLSKEKKDSRDIDSSLVFNEEFGGPVPSSVYYGMATLDTITVASVLGPETGTYYIKESGNEDWTIVKRDDYTEFGYEEGYEYIVVVMTFKPEVNVRNERHSVIQILSIEQKDSQGIPQTDE